MTASELAVLPEPEFYRALELYFEFPPGTVEGASLLRDNLLFDSIMLEELHMMLEELAGHSLSAHLITSLDRCSDLYNVYAQFAEHKIDARSSATDR